MTRREDILGRGLFEVFPDNPDDAAATGVGNLKASLDRVLQNRFADAMALQKYDIRRPESDGGGFEERYWSPFNSPVFDRNRNLTYIIHRVEDVTELVRLKESGIEQARELDVASRSRALLETFVECAPVGLAMFDRNMRYLQVSGRWLEVCGIAGNNVLGKSHYEVFPDLSELWKAAHRRGLAGESLSEEEDWVDLEGRARSIHWEIQPWGDTGQDTGGIIIFMEDVSERQQAEQALHVSQERLAAIIGTAMDAIITLDEEQRVVLFNAAAEKIFGCPAAEVIGQPIDRFIPERSRGDHGRHVQKFGATGATARSMYSPATLYGVRAGGEEFPIEATISQATTGGKQLYTVILRDITHKKQAEELAALYAKSMELDRLKTEFFANMSHELRTPLALILGLVQARLAVGGMAEEERHQLEVIDRNAGLLLRHVNDMLDLSKLDAGRMDAAYREADLAGIVRLAASYFESLAEEHGVSFAIEAPGPLMAQIDPAKIERSVLNLLSNAFKFTPSGGRVSVRVQAGGDRAVLEVEDTGPGVPPHMSEAIFERFRQLESGSTRQFGGTGLGLSIAKQFVSLHGGSLTVKEARGGTGALFRMELPLAAPSGAVVRREAEEPDPEPARRMAAELRKLRPSARGRAAARPGAPVVLLVEDNPDMNRFLSRTLGAAYRVIPAFDGQEGYNKALETHPDLILCDIMMPRMSGEELVRELREQREFDDVPIVLLTAKADEELQVRLLQEGAQDYLYKPVRAEELLAKVARLIADRARATEELEGMHDLSEHLIRVGDRERKEVALELQENTAQCLVAVELKLAMVQDSVAALSPDMQRVLADGIALLQSSVGDIQTVCSTLYPSMLEHFGLKAAVETYVKDFARRSGIEATTEISGEVGRLPAEFEVNLYRVMQEALLNVRRHSGSRTAVVRMSRSGGEVALEVSDQGRGMDLEEGSKDIGLRAMRERMRNLGGRLAVVSGSGGTTVRAALPLG
jgi:PAS domain S-box-containing protein